MPSHINLGGVGGQLLGELRQFNQLGFKVQINGISRQLALDLIKCAFLLALNFVSTQGWYFTMVFNAEFHSTAELTKIII